MKIVATLLALCQLVLVVSGADIHHRLRQSVIQALKEDSKKMNMKEYMDMMHMDGMMDLEEHEMDLSTKEMNMSIGIMEGMDDDYNETEAEEHISFLQTSVGAGRKYNWVWAIGNIDGNLYKCREPCRGRWTRLVRDGFNHLSVTADSKYVYATAENSRTRTVGAFFRPVDGSGSWRSIPGPIASIQTTDGPVIWGVNQAKKLYKCFKPCLEGNWQYVQDGIFQMSADAEHVYARDSRGRMFIVNRNSIKLGISRSNIVINSISAGGNGLLWAISNSGQSYYCAKPCKQGQFSFVRPPQGVRFQTVSAGGDAVYAIGTRATNTQASIRLPRNIQVGQVYKIKSTRRNLYLGDRPGEFISLLGASAGDQTNFRVRNAGNGKVGLQNVRSGSYVGASNRNSQGSDYGNDVFAASQLQSFETLSLADAGGGSVYIRTFHNTYIRGVAASFGNVVDQSGSPGNFERFEFELQPETASGQIYRLETTRSGREWRVIGGEFFRAVSRNMDPSRATYIWATDDAQRVFKCQKPCRRGALWQLTTGEMRQVDADDSYVWGTDQRRQIFKRPVDGSGTWQRISGSLRHVSASGKGWIWGVDNQNNVFRCKKPCTGRWINVPGNLQIVDAGADYVWGTNDGNIFRRPVDGSGTWESIPGTLFDISGGGNGWVWGTQRNGAIYKCKKPCSGSNPWIQVPGQGQFIDAGSDYVFVVNSQGNLFSRPVNGLGMWSPLTMNLRYVTTSSPPISLPLSKKIGPESTCCMSGASGTQVARLNSLKECEMSCARVGSSCKFFDYDKRSRTCRTCSRCNMNNAEFTFNSYAMSNPARSSSKNVKYPMVSANMDCCPQGSSSIIRSARGDDPSSCSMKCAVTPNCKYFSFTASTRTCNLCRSCNSMMMAPAPNQECNTPTDNPAEFGFTLFGQGFRKLGDDLQISGAREVPDRCIPICANNPQCTGLTFKYTGGGGAGYCAFMTGELKSVPFTNNAREVRGKWVKIPDCRRANMLQTANLLQTSVGLPRNIQIGQVYRIKSIRRNLYLGERPGEFISLLGASAGEQIYYTVRDAGNGKVGLQNVRSGNYVGASNRNSQGSDYGNDVFAASQLRSFETLSLADAGGGSVYIRTFHNTYIRGVAASFGNVVDQTGNTGSFERFEFELQPQSSSGIPVTVEAETGASASFVGCYADQRNNRALRVDRGRGRTVEECFQLCRDYDYFGLQFTGECRCGNSGFDRHGESNRCNCRASNVGADVNCVYSTESGTSISVGIGTGVEIGGQEVVIGQTQSFAVTANTGAEFTASTTLTSVRLRNGVNAMVTADFMTSASLEAGCEIDTRGNFGCSASAMASVEASIMAAITGETMLGPVPIVGMVYAEVAVYAAADATAQFGPEGLSLATGAEAGAAVTVGADIMGELAIFDSGAAAQVGYEATARAEASATVTLNNTEFEVGTMASYGPSAEGGVTLMNDVGGAAAGSSLCAGCVGGSFRPSFGFDGCSAKIGATGSASLLVGAELSFQAEINFCSLADTFKQIGPIIVDGIADFADETKDFFEEDLGGFFTQRGRNLEVAGRAIGTWVTRDAARFVENAAQEATQFVVNKFDAVGSRVFNIAAQTIDVIGNIVEDFGRVVNGIVRDAGRVIGGAAQEFANGVAGVAEDIANGLESIGNAIAGVFGF